MKMITEMKEYRYLLYELVKKDIVLKYRRSYLGLLWTLLEPVLTTLVLNFVFSQLYHKKDPYFIIYILIGRLVYTCFASTTKGAMKSIRSHAGMIKKVYVPKFIYPIASILSNFVIFGFSLIVLIIACIIKQVPVSPKMFLAILPLLVLFVMCLGVGMILATYSVYFRDLEYLWGVALMLIMYCSAIFYKMNDFAGSVAGTVIKLNPLYCIITNVRGVIIPNEVTYFSYKSLAYSAALSIVFLVIGLIMFNKKQDKFILYI